MVEVLEKYSGWPVVRGDDWESNRFDWLEISQRISNDGLINLILNWGIGIDLKNSTRRTLIVSTRRQPTKLNNLKVYNNIVFSD